MSDAAAFATVHAVLVCVDKFGVLITGEAGSGKSECALRLISAGHALVADDAVEIRVMADRLIGAAPISHRGLLEVRGIGIIEVTELFGNGAFTPEATVDVVIEICSGDGSSMDRPDEGLGTVMILGRTVPAFRIGNRGNRDLALLIETALKALTSPRSLRPIESIKRVN